MKKRADSVAAWDIGLGADGGDILYSQRPPRLLVLKNCLVGCGIYGTPCDKSGDRLLILFVQ